MSNLARCLVRGKSFTTAIGPLALQFSLKIHLIVLSEFSNQRGMLKLKEKKELKNIPSNELIQIFRRSYFLTQTDVASLFGVADFGTVSRWERGEREPNGLALRLAKILISLDWQDGEKILQMLADYATGPLAPRFVFDPNPAVRLHQYTRHIIKEEFSKKFLEQSG